MFPELSNFLHKSFKKRTVNGLLMIVGGLCWNYVTLTNRITPAVFRLHKMKAHKLFHSQKTCSQNQFLYIGLQRIDRKELVNLATEYVQRALSGTLL